MSDTPPPARPTGQPELNVVSDVAGEFAERVVEAFHCRSGERFGLALTGGPVAAECYERLATHGETQIDWWRVELFLADECGVDASHPDSHERLIRVMLLDRVGAAHLFYPLHSEGARQRAQQALIERSLDLIHLDLGADGRLSSLLPRLPGVFDDAANPLAEVIATADPLGRVPHQRFCLSPAVIERANCVVVTAVGASVADALAAVQRGADVPGAFLPTGRVVWLADRAAARA